MLKIQKYLKENGLDALKEYGIKVCKHEDGRIILNYGIKSPKFNPMVDECRGLCLDENFDLVGRSFDRFYNVGEGVRYFDFDNCVATSKLDGSLSISYDYDGESHMNTRGSFGQGQVNSFPITWHELMSLAVSDWKSRLYGYGLTFVGELCSKYNRVVIPYDKPTYTLLSAFRGEKELERKELEYLADLTKLNLVDEIELSGRKEILAYVEELDGKYNEGLVLKSEHGRIKVKNSTYVLLHHTFSNSPAILIKNIIPIILKGEEDEVLAYFPEFTEEILGVKSILARWYSELEELYLSSPKDRGDKEFALFIKKHPLCGLLFQARRYNVSLREVWVNSERILVNKFKEKNDF